MDKNLVHPDQCPDTSIPIQIISGLILTLAPFWLIEVPPVVEAEHDGEGARGQQLLIVVVIQAVGRCQGKSVANLRGKLETSTTTEK